MVTAHPPLQFSTIFVDGRMGGGFGGKETRTTFATSAAAVAAKILGRPVRLTLSRKVSFTVKKTPIHHFHV